MAGGKQPVKFLFVERTFEPTQHEVHRTRQRSLSERDSQRELEDRAGGSKKDAFDFSAARTGCLCDDQQTGVRVGGKLATAPDRAGCQLGLEVGGFMKMNLAGGLAFGSLMPLAPGVEEAALHGQNAVKSGQKQWRTFCLVSF